MCGHRAVLAALRCLWTGNALPPDQDQTVQVWDTDTGQPVGKALHGHSGIVCTSFLSGWKQVASGSEDGTVREWDTDTGQSVGDALRGNSDMVGRVISGREARRIQIG